MIRRSSVGNLFCHQDHFSYKQVSQLLILVHQEETHLKKAEFIQSVKGTRSTAIVLKVFAEIFPLFALLLL